MEHEIVTTVLVDYKNRDGWHVFTSNDVLGLYVASKDARKAYEDVPIALQKLMELDYSCQCKVSRPLTFEDFERRVLHGATESHSAPELRSEALLVRGRRDGVAARSLRTDAQVTA